jgi:hypothetical protein
MGFNTTGAFTRPSSIGVLLGNPRWGKRLLKFLEKLALTSTPDKVDEIRRITRYGEWHNLVDEAYSEDHGDTTSTPHDSSLTRPTIEVRPSR